ncbi:MAG: Gfo/Idh/MocA family oxidoreductase [Balneolales bacterium]
MDKKNPVDVKNISRRGFVKSTAWSAGGIMLINTLPAGASAWVQGDDKIKIVLIGCGGRGTGAANQALQADEGVVLVAMADIFPDRLESSLERLAGRYEGTGKVDVPEERRFLGFDAYKKAIELADVVLLATPPGFRPVHLEAAIDAGKHVFTEKPLATDAPGVRQVLAAGQKAKEKNLNVVVGLQRRYQRDYQEVKARIKDQVGDIISGQVYWNEEGAWMRERLPEHTEMEYQLRNWFYFTWLSGDLPLEQHIHNLDVANWFIGEYPATAKGMGGREVRTGKEYGNIFDHNFIELTYPGGAKVMSQCRHQPGTVTDVAEVFQGTKGNIQTGWGHNAKISDRKSGSVLYEYADRDDPGGTQVEHIELFKSIRNGGVINNVDYGARSTLTAIMVRMASYSGKLITWDEAMNGTEDLIPKVLSFDATPPILPDENGYYPIAIPGVTNVL